MIVVSVILTSVFIMEVARLNVAQNGTPLAAGIMKNYSKSIKDSRQKVELAISKRLGCLEEDLSTISAAVNAEAAGVKRPEIEDELLEKFNIDFNFSGDKGENKTFRKIKNVYRQKKREFGSAKKDALQDRTNLDKINELIARLSSTNLTPEGYNDFIHKQTTIVNK